MIGYHHVKPKNHITNLWPEKAVKFGPDAIWEALKEIVKKDKTRLLDYILPKKLEKLLRDI